LRPRRYILFFLLSYFSLKSAHAQYTNIEFVENKGQWDNKVQFKGDVGNGAFFVQRQGFTVHLQNPDDMRRVSEMAHSRLNYQKSFAGVHDGQPNVHTPNQGPIVVHSHAYRVDFVGSNPNAMAKPDKPLPGYNNYFIGKDPAKWQSECKIYQGILYSELYPNIDVRYYSEAGHLKYDIIVKPGGRLDQVVMKYDGPDKMLIKSDQLIIKTTAGDVKELSPYAYQLTSKGKEEVNCKFVLGSDNTIRFKVKNYTPNSILVIDPSLIFSSFTGSTADNWGYTATYGPDGSFYAGGIGRGVGFPTSVGAFQVNYAGGSGGNSLNSDIAVIKFDPTGANRVYATYIGGSNDEQPHSMIVDAAGNLVVAGRTLSGDYPTYPAGNRFGGGGSWDIVVTKLNSTGTGLVGSIIIGGPQDDGVNIANKLPPVGTRSLNRNYGDDSRSEVNIDNAGNIVLAACTQSQGFPTTPGAFMTTYGGGGQDAVVLKLNSTAQSVIWSTFLGGSDDDAAYVILPDNSGNLYVAGGTASPNFKGIVTSGGVIANTFQGGEADGFIAEMNGGGTAMVRGTYLGTPSVDQIYGIQKDKNGFIYVMGTTQGAWPVINATYSNAGAKQFIEKIQPNLSAPVYSTTFGTSSTVPNISPVAFLVDRCENVYVSGWGGEANILEGFQSAGTTGLPITPDAIQKTTDGSDFYFFILKKDAASQLYGSFFGQQGGQFPDHVDGGTSRFDANGVIYQGVCGNCGGGTNFPTTPGAWSPINQALASVGGCNMVAVKINLDFSGVKSAVQSSINGIKYDSTGCVPLDVHLADTFLNAKSYIWDFGDGSPQITTTNPDTSHTYAIVGKYRVMLIAIDPASCNVRDTSYVTIIARNDRANLAFTPQKTGLCTDLSFNFINGSTAPPGKPFAPTSFQWDFGDGTPLVTAGTNSVSHTYAAAGTYRVKLLLPDSNYCNSPDSLVQTVRLSPNVKAQFTTPPGGCVPYNAQFTNTSLGGLTFLWDFGDGTQSTDSDPTHLYSAVGTYTVKLVATDPGSCNKQDSSQFTISVKDGPVAAFTFSPNPAQENTPTQFTNGSIGAVSYKWSFGDGDTSSLVNPLHQFNATGNYNTCLAAINEFGCIDTVCQNVPAIVLPLLDVPNAFSPNGDGKNDQVRVRGFGIGKMMFRIYNRWGQVVFETADPNQGWDGRFKGTPQPVDVYAYTLDVQFTDGTKKTKQGDITLLR